MKRSDIDIDKILRDSLPTASRERMEAVRSRIYDYARSGAADPGDAHSGGARLFSWRWAPAMAASFALFVGAIWVAAGWSTRSVYAIVDAPDGSVERVSHGITYPARSGERIGTQEIIRTDGRGAALALMDGSRLEMSVKCELQLERTDDGIRVHLGQGGVIVTAAKQRTGHLYVQTKDVTASVAGTVFLVDAQRQGSRVAVIEGVVEIQDAPFPKKLTSGETLATYPSIPPVPLSQQVAWSQSAPAHLALLQTEIAQSNQAAASSAPASIQFGVASVKTIAAGTPYRGEVPLGLACHGIDGTRRSPFSNSGAVVAPQGRCVGSGVLLFDLIGFAFGVPPRFVYGGEDWVRTPGGGSGIAGFQIEGVADDPSTATTEQLTSMLQTMLADRFKLKVHRETQQSPGYALVVANGGPKLKASSGDAQSPFPFVNEKRQLMINGKSTIGALAQLLMTSLDAPIVDKTGIAGNYEYEIPSPPIGGGQRGFAQTGAASSAADRAAAYSEILEDRLGLRLQTEKSVSVQIIVIDHVERPSAN